MPPVVLIVDDLDDIRQAYRTLLESHGFEVLEAPTAVAGIEILSLARVDVVLADLYMPGKFDGIDLVKHVTNLPPPRPRVVAMSGAPNIAFRHTLEAARYIGADATFVKSDEPAALVETIRSLIGGSSLAAP